MKNPLAPHHLSPRERRAELCGLLALGLVRLHMRMSRQLFDPHGDSSLHFSRDPSGHATAQARRER